MAYVSRNRAMVRRPETSKRPGPPLSPAMRAKQREIEATRNEVDYVLTKMAVDVGRIAAAPVLSAVVSSLMKRKDDKEERTMSLQSLGISEETLAEIAHDVGKLTEKLGLDDIDLAEFAKKNKVPLMGAGVGLGVLVAAWLIHKNGKHEDPLVEKASVAAKKALAEQKRQGVPAESLGNTKLQMGLSATALTVGAIYAWSKLADD